MSSEADRRRRTMATVTKMRVHELAKQLGTTSARVLEACGELGIVATTASSGIDADAVERVRARLTPRDPHEVDQAAGDAYWAGVMHGHGRPPTPAGPQWAPPPSPRPATSAPQPATALAGREGVVVVLLGALGLAVGSFLPWLTATAPFVGTISRSGLDGGGDGILTLIAGIVVGLLGFR